MGTNFYAESGFPRTLIHLGKSSAGWRFCARFYDKAESASQGLPATFDEWKAFVSKADRIVNEYGDAVTVAALLDLIEAKKDQRSERQFHGVGTDGPVDFIVGEFS